MFLAFDEEMAQVVGLPVTFLYYLLLSIMALTVVIAIKWLASSWSALLVLPGATASSSPKISCQWWRSRYCGLIATLSGLYARPYPGPRLGSDDRPQPRRSSA